MDATRGIMSGTMDRFKKVFEKKSNRKIMGMDLGVGSFVLMNAVTSRQARNIKSSMSWWKAAFKSATPLLLLGFARLASTLSLDYQILVRQLSDSGLSKSKSSTLSKPFWYSFS
ncbi:uncharacterized protein At4g17910 isoform X4 [Gossypium hirsutum]|uniref:Uncharacterized protein At4g17910 isoform X4 n=1 Tax=Gossypium hirsutum TaxID=3635 RepID=A0ABM3AKB2_GOSHI|nr:uncharacterized protein At4g17910-like isoform X4 [Gossypium hirsutum]